MRSNGKRSRDAWAGHLSAAVRLQRRALRLTQRQLSELAGVGPAFLYALENGKQTLRLDKLLDVLRVLGLRLTLEPGEGGLVVRAST